MNNSNNLACKTCGQPVIRDMSPPNTRVHAGVDMSASYLQPWTYSSIVPYHTSNMAQDRCYHVTVGSM